MDRTVVELLRRIDRRLARIERAVAAKVPPKGRPAAKVARGRKPSRIAVPTHL